jgi:hypothetical protein
MWCPNVEFHPLIPPQAGIQIVGPTTIAPAPRFRGDWVE